MRALVTGGCGFIGCNTAGRLVEAGYHVTILDNLSRRGSESNLSFLQKEWPLEFFPVDVRDKNSLANVIRVGQFDVIVHLAAQVAVTSSVADPETDFDINAHGTLNVLEAVRSHSPHSIILNASTNKVYGDLADVGIVESSSRYGFADMPFGVSEAQRLSFHSPYGCSKGAADQYVVDYSRVYNLATVTLRQSCIYGPRQFGVEDQGWVAWFAIANALGLPIQIYGDGKQVRDILFVDELVDCYLKAIDRIDQVKGMCLNVGGGPGNALSLLECLDLLAEVTGKRVDYTLCGWRPGDQRIFVSDVRTAETLLHWSPQIRPREGVHRLCEWVSKNLGMLVTECHR